MTHESKTLESMLSVGAKAVVATQPDNPDGPRLVVTLRGWQRGQFLILDISANDRMASSFPGRPKRHAIAAKSIVVIRFIIEGEVLAFRETVLEAFYVKDIPHFAIRWPHSYESMKVRKFERFEVEARCKIVLGSGDAVLAATADLSMGGCGVRVERPLERGANVSLALTLPDGTRLEGVAAVVRAVSETPDGFFAGLEFASVPERARRDLEFFLETLRMFRVVETEETLDRILLLTGNGADGLPQAELSVPGHSVTALTDVVECFHRLRMRRPKAVVIDCRQKSWSGMDVCAYIRANPHLKDVRIVLLGLDAQHTDAATRLLGADACIPDTVASPAQAADMIAAALEAGSDRQPAAAAGL